MKNRNLTDSFNNAVNGIIQAVKSERNMKIHIIAAAVVAVMSIYYRLSRQELIAVCIAVALVIVCELFNSAIELVVDIIVDVYHPKAKLVKDIAAGAVLVSALAAAAVGYFVFFDKVCGSVDTGISALKRTPMSITVIAIFITLLVVLTLKTLQRHRTPLKGGMPSGHAAVAFSITTAVAIGIGNTKATVLAVVLSLLVIQSRLEAGIHTLFELAVGAFLGFLITLLLFQLFYL